MKRFVNQTGANVHHHVVFLKSSNTCKLCLTTLSTVKMNECLLNAFNQIKIDDSFHY